MATCGAPDARARRSSGPDVGAAGSRPEALVFKQAHRHAHLADFAPIDGQGRLAPPPSVGGEGIQEGVGAGVAGVPRCPRQRGQRSGHDKELHGIVAGQFIEQAGADHLGVQGRGVGDDVPVACGQEGPVGNAGIVDHRGDRSELPPDAIERRRERRAVGDVAGVGFNAQPGVAQGFRASHAAPRPRNRRRGALRRATATPAPRVLRRQAFPPSSATGRRFRR